MTPSVLVAGIGNIFECDDAFGVSVAAKLAQSPLPAHVRVEDFGIRGFDLMLALLDGYDLTIFVDAVSRGAQPGTEKDPHETTAHESKSPLVWMVAHMFCGVAHYASV